MPSSQNILHPINLHGLGRSGTTLLQNILSEAGCIQVCNETSDTVFLCYRGGELLRPSHDKEAVGLTGDPGFAARAVHATLCATMPSRKPSWCHKLGGLPKSLNWEPLVCEGDPEVSEELGQFPAAWYWAATTGTFPFAKDVLIVRNHLDVIASRVAFSGYDPIELAADVAAYYRLMAHPASRVGHVLRYEALVRHPEAVVERLFHYLGLPYQDGILRALQWHAVPTAGRPLESARALGFTWQEHYDELPVDEIEAIVQPAWSALHARFATQDPS